MFDNSGYKIKIVAKVAFIIESIVAILFYILIMNAFADTKHLPDGFGFAMFIILVLIIGAAYISNLFLYGFGELIESTTITSNNTAVTYNNTAITSNNTATASNNTSDYASYSYKKPLSAPIVYNPPPAVHPKGDEWICSECGDKNPSNINICKGCGKYR